MSYGNDRYGGDNNYGGGDGDNEGNNRGGRHQENNQSEFGGQGYGGQEGGYGQGNSGHGGQPRRDDDSGYDQRRDELRNHGQSGYGFVSSASSSDGLTADSTT
jgi:hypothetical protein